MFFERTNKARISYTFYWPGLREDCLQYVKMCETCQLKARVTYRDQLGAAGPRRCFRTNNLRNFHNFRKFHVPVESVPYDSLCFVNTCAVVYENDNDFGEIVIPLSTEVSSPVSPSEMIDRNSISHLGSEQQAELLAVLDLYPECFSDVPGLMDVIKHLIPLVPGFKPKRLYAYRVPERLKPKVDRQIQEMLDNGIIQPSRSPMLVHWSVFLKGRKVATVFVWLLITIM